MNLAYEDTLKYFITLLTIINPIGVIPVILDLTQDFSDDQLHKIARYCSLAVGITLLTSLLIGENILNFFGISLPSFTIGGGILIFLMAFSMVQAKQSTTKINTKERLNIDATEIGIVPLAIPLLAGPGSISTSVIFRKGLTTNYHFIFTFVAIIIISLFILVIIHNSRTIAKKIGNTGMNIFTRIMGIILLSISIEMFATGIKEFIAGQ